MSRYLYKIFNLRAGEAYRVLLMFFYIFLIIGSYLILKPMTRSLFLKNLGPEQLPVVYMLVALVVGVVAVTYARFSAKLRLDRLINLTTLFLISNLLVFWWLLSLEIKDAWLYYLLYTWVSIYGVLTVSQFWLMANYVFNSREAKRIFPILAGAAIAGGISGGYFTKLMVKVVGGTNNLAFLCMGFLLATLLLMNLAWRRRDPAGTEVRGRRQDEEGAGFAAIVGEVFSLIRHSRHLALLMGIVSMTVMVSQIVDFQFSTFASQEIKGTDDLTGFLGFWLSNLSVISLLFQMVAAGGIIRRFGVGAATLFLPVAMLFTSLWVFVGFGLVSILVVKIADGVFRYSINKAGVELLFLPIPTGVKKKTKAFIDMFADRLARGISGFLLLVFYTWMGLSIAQISLVSVALVGIWLVVVFAMRGEYVNSFRRALQKREIDWSQLTINLEEAATLQLLADALSSDNERDTLYALNLLNSNAHVQPQLPLQPLLKHHSAEVRRLAASLINRSSAANGTAEMQSLLNDDDPGVRVEAMCHLINHSPEGRKAQLQKFLQGSDSRLRAAAIGYLAAYGSPDDQALLDENLIERIFAHNGGEGREERVQFGRVLGALAVGRLLPHLQRLLNDPAEAVVKQAILSAGKTRDRQFVQTLMNFLGNKSYRAEAREALAMYGEKILGTLNDYFMDERVDPVSRRNIPRVISRIPAQQSLSLLLLNLDQVQQSYRRELGRALSALRQNHADLRIDHRLVETAIRTEAQAYYTHFRIREIYRKSPAADSAERQLLTRALDEYLLRSREIIFQLLALIYPPKDIRNAFAGVTSRQKSQRASAVEFLDNLMEKEIKKLLMPMLDELSPAEVQRKARDLFQLEIADEATAFTYLLNSREPWLRACALFSLKRPVSGELREHIRQSTADAPALVEETARLVLNARSF